MELATLTTSTADLASTDVALLPTGSTEQHGPALPLGMDHFAAETIAVRIDRDDTVVLPTVSVGVSEHHRQFDGTLWVGAETFERYVTDVAESVASHGVRKLVLVNGHGGNTDALARAARHLRQAQTAFAAPWNWWEALGDRRADWFDEEGGHADALETSVMLAMAPDLVDEEQLAAAESGGSEGWGSTVHGADIGFDTIDFSESGAVGRPTAGSAIAGERVIEYVTDELAALIDWLAQREFDELLPKPHK
jgi:creatinine amidohydrolase